MLEEFIEQIFIVHCMPGTGDKIGEKIKSVWGQIRCYIKMLAKAEFMAYTQCVHNCSYYHLVQSCHFTDEETEAQRGLGIYSKAH